MDTPDRVMLSKSLRAALADAADDMRRRCAEVAGVESVGPPYKIGEPLAACILAIPNPYDEPTL